MQVNVNTSTPLRAASTAPRAARAEAPDTVELSYLPAHDQAARTAYYGDVLQTRDGKELYSKLNRLLTDTHTFSMDYSTTQKVAPFLSLYPDGTMHCVYTGARFASPVQTMPEHMADLAKDDPAWLDRWAKVTALASIAPEAAAMGMAVQYPKYVPAHDQGTFKEVRPYSLEHLVPQSWFERMRPMRTDLHILSPVANDANSSRANLPLQDLPASTPEVAGGKSDLQAFDPKAGKGEAARATLYFLLRHPGFLGDSPGEYRPSDLKRLLDWHKRYPVTDFERHKNAEVFQLQGNRNPLVDFPELAERIDFTQGFAAQR